MKSSYVLTVVTDSTDHASLKNLRASTGKLGLTHLAPLAAYDAASKLSMIPGVNLVRCSLIQEKPEGVWRKGKHYRE